MRVVPLLVTLLAALAVVSQAVAKDDVIARLENPSALRAPAGTTISVIWTLRVGKQAFGASGVYVRLRGRAGTTTSAYGVETARGRYRARLHVPAGGTRSIVIGLRGWRSDIHGTSRADVFFPIANDPTRG
jgi:hypothetical protein